jgi:hypothetical protein
VRELLKDDQLDTPLAIGIFGEWGSGKTSVMRMLQEELPSQDVTLWFDAWHYAHQEETLWRALLLSVVERLRSEVDRLAHEISGDGNVEEERAKLERELDDLVTTLYRSYEYQQIGDLRVNWQAAIPLALQMALTFVPAGKDLFDNIRSWFSKDGKAKEVMSLVERERTTVYRDQVRSLEQFQRALRPLIAKYLSSGSGQQSRRLLFIFIDDLDRCLPEAAVGTLEALKLFLDIPGCVFILGMDRRVVEQGIRSRYHQPVAAASANSSAVNPELYIDASQYLDKIIQIPFMLPPLANSQIRNLIESWAKDHNDYTVLNGCADVIVYGVAANPRRVKRTLNVLRLVRSLRPASSQDDEEQELQRLAKLVVVQTSYEDVYARIVESPRALKAVEAAALSPVEGTEEMAIIEGRPRLAKMLQSGARFTEMTDEEVGQLLYAVRVSHAPSA